MLHGFSNTGRALGRTSRKNLILKTFRGFTWHPFITQPSHDKKCSAHTTRAPNLFREPCGESVMREFAAGFACAVIICGGAWLFRQLMNAQDAIYKERMIRKRRFKSLCRALALPGDQSENDVKRAMVALCHGEQLIFEQIDPKLLRFLGYIGESKIPLTAYELLPPSMEQHHRQWVARSLQSGQLPARLSHPLRSVDVRHASGHYIRMDLIIEWVTDASEPVFQLVFASVDPSSVYQLQTLSTGEQVPCCVSSMISLVEIRPSVKMISSMKADSRTPARCRWSTRTRT